MLFKDISYLECWQLFCSGECNYLCKFGRGYHKEITSNLDQWFRCRLKDFLSGALAALLFGRAELFVQFWLRALRGSFL